MELDPGDLVRISHILLYVTLLYVSCSLSIRIIRIAYSSTPLTPHPRDFLSSNIRSLVPSTIQPLTTKHVELCLVRK